MAEFIRKKLVGTWKLTSWTYNNHMGETIPYFGENATGILMYDKHGYMNAQLLKGGRSFFDSAALDGGSPQEIYEAFHSYIAYFGRYEEHQPGEITHIVEGSLFPNWIGNRQLRYGTIKKDCLVLKTPPILVKNTAMVFSVSWKRVL
jgi:hypothetical protein